MRNIAALVLVCALLGTTVPAAANDCLKQGEFAVALALKIHLEAVSEAAAVKNLSELGVKPVKGWDPPVSLDEKSFGEVERALVSAFAKGRLAGGGPAAARAVLAGISMSGDCRQRYFAAEPIRTPGLQAPLAKGFVSTALVKPEVLQQRRSPAGDGPASADIPVREEPEPGLKDPEPGKKPVPISPFEPWDGPTRPGPGSKE